MTTEATRQLQEAYSKYPPGDPRIHEAFEARNAEVIGSELAAPQPGLWFFSFIDHDRQVGDKFIGAAVVEADGYFLALQRTWELRINPGGEVAGVGPLPIDSIAPEWRDRLLSRADVAAIPEPPR